MTRVYLFRGAHPLYETLAAFPPEGIEYLPVRKGKDVESYTLYESRHSFLRSSVNRFFKVTGMPRVIPILGCYDLVHSSRGFFVVGPNNYVVDLEHISSFAGMKHSKMESPRFRRLVEKGLSFKKCTHIMPHCEMAKRTMSMVTDDPGILRKTTVVYPAVKPRLETPRRKDSIPDFLFYGEYYWKGGREFLEACMRLASKLDFHVTYISLRVHPPAGVVKRAQESLNIDYTEGPVAREELLNHLYPRADAFVMPTNIDTFGYAFLEAMSFGLPCIGTSHFAVPEIIEDGVTGFTVNPLHSCFDESGRRHRTLSVETAESDSVVRELCACLEKVIDSASLRYRMGVNALNAVRDGKFSISTRNKLLKEIYGTSLKK